MHNGCTTALEASVIGKPIITYLPSNRKYKKNFPNKLGFHVNSLKQLSHRVNLLFKNSNSKKNLKDKEIPKLLSQKIYFDNKELASEKIIREWERLYKIIFIHLLVGKTLCIIKSY